MLADLTHLWIKTLFERNHTRRNPVSISPDENKNRSLRLSRRDGGIPPVPFSRGRDAVAQSFLLQARYHDDWN